MARKLTPAERFFYDHTGYSYGPGETPAQGKRRGAIALAAAEAWAKANSCYYDWSEDLDGYPTHACVNGVWGYWHDPGEGDLMRIENCESCVMRDYAGTVLGSLCGIWDASPEYRRVVQAELASQAQSEADDALEADLAKI